MKPLTFLQETVTGSRLTCNFLFQSPINLELCIKHQLDKFIHDLINPAHYFRILL